MVSGYGASKCFALPKAQAIEVGPGIWIVGNEHWAFDHEYTEFLLRLLRTRLPDAANIIISHSPNEDYLLGKLFDEHGILEDNGLLKHSKLRRLAASSTPTPTPTRPFVILGCNGAVRCAAKLTRETGIPSFGTAGIVTPTQDPAGGTLFLGKAMADQFGVDSVQFNTPEAVKVFETGAVGGEGGRAREPATLGRELRKLLDHGTPEELAEWHAAREATGDANPGLDTRPGGCFVAGTAVATAEGERAIEELEPGDRVWAYDPDTGDRALKRVVRTFARPPTPIQRVQIQRGERVEELRTTPEHPFLVRGRGWIEASQLLEGMELVTLSGLRATVVGSLATGETAPVFNLEVEDLHTYVAGDVVVHNKCSRFFARLARLGNAQIPFTPSTAGLLMGVTLAMHVGHEGVARAAVMTGIGIVQWELGTRALVAGVGRVAGEGAAKAVGWWIPVIGEILLAGEVALMITNYWVGAEAGWGDIWDAYTGKLDEPTRLAGPPPPEDETAYYD